MTKANVSINVRSLNPTTYVLDIVGEINAFAENTLMDAYTQASSKGAQNIVLNFSELEYMNSSGIGLLVTLLIRVNRQKQHLLACGLSDHYKQIFTLTRLNEAIRIFADEDDVLESVAA